MSSRLTLHSLNRKNKKMNHQMLIWSLLVMVMVFIFVVREANKVKRSAGHGKFFEISDEYTIYSYDEDDN